MSSCGKEKSGMEYLSYADEPFTCCHEFTASASSEDTSEETVTRGWEGELAPDGKNLSTVYPLKEIFLVVENPKDNYEKLSFPVNDLDGERRVFDICFRAEGQKLWAKSGEQEILVADGTPFKCNFYSSDELLTSMKLGNAKTPGGTSAYDPYGDRLFKSSDLEFRAEGNQVYVNNKLLQNFSLSVNRITNVLMQRFIICDDLEADKLYFQLTPEQFTEKTGTLFSDWEITAFIAGHEEAGEPYRNGFPLEYSFSGGTNEEGARGIISVSPEIETFDKDVTHAFNPPDGNVAIYQGIGFNNKAIPFLFPAKTGGAAEICFSIYYRGNNPNIKKQSSTFRVMALTDLINGQLKIVTIVMDVDDFISAFLNDTSRSMGPIKKRWDTVFGDVAEVPYKIIVE